MTATRHHFVFLNPCGCPLGVLDAEHAPTEYDAWMEMFVYVWDIRRAQSQGVTVIHVDHATYEVEFYPKMLGTYQCPHN